MCGFFLGLLGFMLAVPTAALAGAIAWRNYDAEAFRVARDSGRPLIVNVGHEGCSACRTMAETTFADARVIALINSHFVAIQVDSEMQPDIGERYSDWAWPATAFLKPDATQVFAIRGSRRPDDFVALLERVIERHQAGELKSDTLAPYTAPTHGHAGPLQALLMQVRAQLDGSFDDQRGGWGEAKILEYAEPTLQLFMRGRLYADGQATTRALQTASGFLQHLDPIWGGSFYASFERWDKVVREKRLESQAAALQLFADALQVSGDARFREGLHNVHRYLRDWMRAPSGSFYANQKDVGPRFAPGMDIDAYYRLDDAGRRRYGLPVIDRAIYTDVNARVITGLVRAYEASTDADFLATAVAAATALRTQRQTDHGWIEQFAPADEMPARPRVHALRVTGLPYLRAQAHFGLAALALYQATSDERWRESALAIVRGLGATLEDHALGGFYAAPPSALDDIVGRRKPLEDNAAAARLLYWLGVLEQDSDLKRRAERTLRAVAVPDIVRREGRVTGSLALSLELLNAGHVEFSVVGAGPAAETLLAAGRKVYEPRRVLHREEPGRYPRRERAAMYICNDDHCSLPITEADEIAAQAAQFLPAAPLSGATR